MEKIQKYCSKKNLFIGTIVSGLIGIGLFIMAITLKGSLEHIQSFSDIESIVGKLKNICYLYYLDFIVLFVLLASYSMRLLKLNDQTQETKVLLGGSGGAFLLSMISLGAISSILSISGGNFSYATSINNLEDKMILIGIKILLQLASACYAGFLLHQYKDTQQEKDTTASKETKEGDNMEDAISVQKNSIVKKIKEYYATPNGKKNIHIGGGVIGIVIVALIGLNVFNSLKRTPIDMTKSCYVEFEGISGLGSASVNCTYDYDMSNAEIEDFVSSITYEIENDGALKNGDSIQIKAQYDEETAERLKLEPENTTMEVEVTDLKVAYLKFEDIPNEISSNFETATKQMLEKEILKDVGGFFAPSARTVDKMECIGIYYKYDEYSDGIAYYIYRTEETLKHNSSSTEKQVNYYITHINNIKSEEEVDLSTDSTDMDYYFTSDFSVEKKDENILKSFKDSHKGIEIVKENPSTLTYKNEMMNK